ncbi:MAG: hypothetical protein Q4E62_03020 [Sutterellaceae bacterium]|nr:hypothetical protein [Sutterellaceae bacterium]
MSQNIRFDSLYSPCPKRHLAPELWTLRLLVYGHAWRMMTADCIDGPLKNRWQYYVRGLMALLEKMKDLRWVHAKAFREKPDKSYKDLQCLSPYLGDAYDQLKAEGYDEVKDFVDTPKELLDALQECEKELKTRPLFESPMRENLELLAKLFALSHEAVLVLAFFVFIACDYWVKRVANCFNCDERGFAMVLEILSCATGLRVEKIRELFNDKNGNFSLIIHPLRAPKLAEFEEGAFDLHYRLNKVLDLNQLQSERLTEKTFFESIFSEAGDSDLTLSDFDHIPPVRETLLSYLKGLLTTHKTGVNILLYGESGTGNTELSRVLAKTLGIKAFEICRQDKVTVGEDDENLVIENIETRLDLLEMAGVLLRNNRDMFLVVDDAEDVLSQGVQFHGAKHETLVRFNKARLNRLLEANTCPTLWITNSLE